MLILGRKPQQGFYINNKEITINILKVEGKTVRIGIEAPNDVTITRKEIYQEPELITEFY